MLQILPRRSARPAAGPDDNDEDVERRSLAQRIIRILGWPRRALERMLWQDLDGERVTRAPRSDRGPFGGIGSAVMSAGPAIARATGRLAMRPLGTLTTITVEELSLKAVITRGNHVRAWGSVPLPPGMVHDGLVAAPEGFAERLADLMETMQEGGKIAGRRVSVAIAGRNMVQRRFTIAEPEEVSLREAILAKCSERLSISPDELQLDWHVADLPQAEDDEDAVQQHDVYALGMYRNVVEANLGELASLGAQPVDVRPKALALAAAVNVPTALVLDIEQKSLSVLIVRERLPEVVREVSIEPGMTRLQWVQLVTTQVSRSIGYHDSLYPDSPIPPDVPLFVTGDKSSDKQLVEEGLARLPYVQQEMPKVLTAPVAFPFAEFAANVGLALRNGKRFWQPAAAAVAIPPPRLEFLPHAYRPRALPVRTIAIGTASAVLIIGAGAGYDTVLAKVAEVERLEATAVSLDQRLAANLQTRRDIAQIEAAAETAQSETVALLGAAEAIRGLNRGFGVTLTTVTALRPADVRLQHVDDDGALMVIRASGETYAALLAFVRALDADPAFEKVSIRTIGGTAPADEAEGGELAGEGDEPVEIEGATEGEPIEEGEEEDGEEPEMPFTVTIEVRRHQPAP